MVKIKNFIDTPSQTAGPFLHIGCTPSITGINIFKDELGSTPFKNISLNEEINIKGKIYDGNNDPIIDAMIETWQCDKNGKYFPCATDLAIMFPMLEMAGNRQQFVKDILYVYNEQNPISNHNIRRKQQIAAAKEIRRKKRYKEKNFI